MAAAVAANRFGFICCDEGTAMRRDGDGLKPGRDCAFEMRSVRPAMIP
jgi:hypothetical protein